MTITNEKLISILGTAALLGITGTVAYAKKTLHYRKELIKSINATNTMTHLVFLAKDWIDDPEKLAKFEKEIEFHVTQTGELNRAL